MASAAAHAPAKASQAQLARLLGISRQAVNDLVNRNIIPIDAGGKIDVALARVALAERVRPSAKSNAESTAAEVPPAGNTAGEQDPDHVPLSYHVAKTLREAANARMDQLRLRKMQGELTEISKVEAAIFTASRMLRDMVLNVPKRIAADAVATGDARLCERMMADALRRCFIDFQQMASATLAAPEGDAAAEASTP